jgi:signal transduction histidine kinase
VQEARARGETVLSTQELTLMAVPVKLEREVAGALVVGFHPQRAISSADMLFFSSMAHQAAVALENRHLYLQAQGRGILEERERLAKEMHDGLGQTLTYLSAMVGTMEQLLRKGRTKEAQRQLAQAKEMLAEAHQEIRQAIFHLRQKPTEGGLIAQVAELLRQMETQWRVKADLRVEIDPSLSLPLEVESQILRIVQEALTNVRKHAQARSVAVRFRSEGAVLRVEVEDDGRGFDLREAKEAPGRFGLRIMEERAQAIGAELRVVSAPGQGTRVELLVPILIPVGGRR